MLYILVEAYAKRFNVYILQFKVTKTGAELIDMQCPLRDTGFNKMIGIAVRDEMFDCLIAVKGREQVFEKNMKQLVMSYISSGAGIIRFNYFFEFNYK